MMIGACHSCEGELSLGGKEEKGGAGGPLSWFVGGTAVTVSYFVCGVHTYQTLLGEVLGYPGGVFITEHQMKLPCCFT